MRGVRNRTRRPGGPWYARPVPLFYFHVRDGERLTPDPDGAELPGLDAARENAAAAVREAVCSPAAAGRDLSRRRFEIADGSGRVLATVAFRDVLGLH